MCILTRSSRIHSAAEKSSGHSNVSQETAVFNGHYHLGWRARTAMLNRAVYLIGIMVTTPNVETSTRSPRKTTRTCTRSTCNEDPSSHCCWLTHFILLTVVPTRIVIRCGSKQQTGLTPIKRALLALMCTASLLAPAAAHAAEFKWWKGPGLARMASNFPANIVTGDKDRCELYYKAILADHERSRNPYVYATQFAPVVTMHLSSQGGVIGEAVYIGILIKKYEIETYVSNNSTCASACGFMWLAGSRRFIDSDSRVGFHAVYNRETGQYRQVPMRL